MNLVGKKVKIFLKNGSGTEGIVMSWNAHEAVLSNDQSDDILVINNPSENIIMYKIFQAGKIAIQESIPAPIIREGKSPTNLEKLIDLKKERIKLEKEEFKNRIRSHSIRSGIVKYEYPDFTKSSFIDAPSEKNPGRFRRNS